MRAKKVIEDKINVAPDVLFYKDYNKQRKIIIEHLVEARRKVIKEQMDLVKQYFDTFCSEEARQTLLMIWRYQVINAVIDRRNYGDKSITDGLIRISTFSSWDFIRNKYVTNIPNYKPTDYSITVVLYPLEKAISSLKCQLKPVTASSLLEVVAPSMHLTSFLRKQGIKLDMTGMEDVIIGTPSLIEAAKKHIEEMTENFVIQYTIKTLKAIG